jgi:hypothetical protein
MESFVVKKVFIIVFLPFSIISPLSSLLKANIRHDPDHLFLKSSPGKYAVGRSGKPIVWPCPATKADELHKNNIKGKGIKIAVLDKEFHPNDIEALNKKGCILPLVLQKKLVLTPNEHLEKVDLKQLKSELLTLSRLVVSANTNQKERNIKKANEYKRLIHRKEYFDTLNKKDFRHGPNVVNMLNSIAPEAQLLPIDVGAVRPNPVSRDFASAIHEAINNKVDAISISYVVCSGGDRDYIDALKEAAQKGIALIFGVGNESKKEKAVFLDKVNNVSSLIYSKRDDNQIFEELKGKGILYCGSLGYKESGEESFSDFSQHPTQDTLRKYLLVPGENVIIHCQKEGYLVGSGTSYSTPAGAGALALLKQYAKNKQFVHTTEDLLQILFCSGHNLTHNVPGTPFKTYKVINLANALKLADQILKPAGTIPSHIDKKRGPLPKKPVAIPIQKQPSLAQKAQVGAKKPPIQAAKIRTAIAQKTPTAKKNALLQAAKTRASISQKTIIAKKNLLIQAAKTRAAAARKAAIIRKAQTTKRNALIQSARIRTITARKVAIARKVALEKKRKRTKTTP